MSETALTPAETDELQRLHEQARSRSHYQVLEVPDSASPDDIQEAFYKLSRKWHPDRFFRRDIGSQNQLIEEVYVAITEAYRTLTDRNLRLAYDRKLREDARLEHGDPLSTGVREAGAPGQALGGVDDHGEVPVGVRRHERVVVEADGRGDAVRQPPATQQLLARFAVIRLHVEPFVFHEARAGRP